ncbi:hypothetical protein FB107DRAFT_256016, partial [Schizophyllum commune]
MLVRRLGGPLLALYTLSTFPWTVLLSLYPTIYSDLYYLAADYLSGILLPTSAFGLFRKQESS